VESSKEKIEEQISDISCQISVRAKEKTESTVERIRAVESWSVGQLERKNGRA